MGSEFVKVLRTMVRVYVQNVDAAVQFYEKLIGVKCQHRFSYAEVGLELASVGNLLLICGTEDVLKPFRATHATLLVDSLDEYKDFLELNGGKIIAEPKKVPTGWNMTVKHADGTIIEYVEHIH
jgi:predicted enzyme related to lactoylglutathione lyase